MSIALAATTNGNLRDSRIIIAKRSNLLNMLLAHRSPLLVFFNDATRSQYDGREESGENDANISGRDPVVENIARVELVDRRSAFECAEPDAV